MKPLFPFYGSKWRSARLYPPPLGRVVEPFAGSAGYAVYHEPAEVLLYDADPIIVGVWDYLIRASVADVMALPEIAVGESVDDFPLPQEAKWLIGFWLNRGSASPKKTRTAFSTRTERGQLVWGAKAKARIAGDKHRVAHWKVKQSDYTAIPNASGTWFVDPPYVDKGRYYRFATVSYTELGSWCLRRRGRLIVCEQSGAAWLPFTDLARIKSTRGVSEEVVYTADQQTTLSLFE